MVFCFMIGHILQCERPSFNLLKDMFLCALKKELIGNCLMKWYNAVVINGLCGSFKLLYLFLA